MVGSDLDVVRRRTMTARCWRVSPAIARASAKPVPGGALVCFAVVRGAAQTGFQKDLLHAVGVQRLTHPAVLAATVTALSNLVSSRVKWTSNL